MADEIHVGDIGTLFTLTISDAGTAVDLSSATTKEIVLQKPDGTTAHKAAAFVTSGADGKLKYTTVANDLDQAGAWLIQAHVVLSTGEWRSEVDGFEVYGNLG
jgi:hypothetical protein